MDFIVKNWKETYCDEWYSHITKSTHSWNYSRLSSNHNITWRIVKKYCNEKWNYRHLSKNPNITWEIVLENSDVPWDYRGLSKNPNITFDIVINNKDRFRILRG